MTMDTTYLDQPVDILARGAHDHRMTQHDCICGARYDDDEHETWCDAYTEDAADYQADAWDDDDDWDDETVGTMWNRYGWRDGADLRQKAVVAHGMVSAVVSAFARGGNYRVTFDETMSTAGTDLQGRKVTITAMPLADPTLSTEQAASILTGLAAHEVAHDRYGRGQAAAVTRAFGADNHVAQNLSNILMDVNNEKRFTAEYPGYSGIFQPLLAYVAHRDGETPKIDDSNPLNIACAAIRYDEWTTYTAAAEADRAWFKSWSAKWSHEDSPKRHAAAIAEAIEHIGADRVDTLNAIAKMMAGTGMPTDGSAEGVPSCVADGADDAAAANGARGAAGAVNATAEEAVRDAANYDDNGDFGVIDVMRSVKITRSRSVGMTGSSAAASAIRNAFMRGRGGQWNVQRGTTRGRLDSHSIHRIAEKRADVFSRRSASSPKRLNVWVMIDCSSSMRSRIADAASVAKALADASKSADNVRMSVYGWSDPFRTKARGVASAGVARVWSTGMDTNEVFRLTDLPMSGTPDAEALRWAVGAIRDETRHDETPLIIVATDGAGNRGQSTMAAEVEAGRKRGVDIRGVAFGRVQDDYFVMMYGRKNWTKWLGDVIATARPLATMITDALR